MSLGYPQERGGSILIRSYGMAMRCQWGTNASAVRLEHIDNRNTEVRPQPVESND